MEDFPNEMADPTPTPNPKGRFSPEVEQALRKAGWFPGRVASKEQMNKWLVVEWPVGDKHIQSRLFSAAWHVLREFGGLEIKQSDRGPFTHQNGFSINPLKVQGKYWGEDGWFLAEWCADGALFPLGMHDEFAVAITGQGQIIGAGVTSEWLIGNTIEEALANLIVGNTLEDWDTAQDKFEEASYLLPRWLKHFGV